MSLQTEGIVLQAIPFKEYDRILTLFSSAGLLKFFVKVRKKDYLKCIALTSPWTRVELHYTLGRGDLHRMTEGFILSQHLRLRESLEILEAADTMTKAILHSQLQGKPAPKLYSLLCLFLHQLPSCHYPKSLASAFLIKILTHEGLLQLSTHQSTYRYGGELYFPQEAPPNHVVMTGEEEKMLSEITHSRSLPFMTSLSLSVDLQSKIATMFQQVYS